MANTPQKPAALGRLLNAALGAHGHRQIAVRTKELLRAGPYRYGIHRSAWAIVNES